MNHEMHEMLDRLNLHFSKIRKCLCLLQQPPQQRCHFMDKNQPFDPLGSPQVTTAAQTPAEVAESTGEADSSVNKRPAHMTDNDPQNFHYK